MTDNTDISPERVREMTDEARNIANQLQLVGYGGAARFVRDQRTALTALLARVEWKPIETAPRDGSPILARSSHYEYPFVVFWSARCIEFGPMPALPAGSLIEKSWMLSCADEEAELSYEPEEWMSLAALNPDSRDG